MKSFHVSAKVKNIYNNGQDFIDTTYRAPDKEKALQGFIEYLESNPNIINYNNVKIEDV